MPIFRFRCRKCRKEFEELLLGAADKVRCPECRSEKLEKLPTSFSSHVPYGCAGNPDCRHAAGSCGCHGECHCR